MKESIEQKLIRALLVLSTAGTVARMGLEEIEELVRALRDFKDRFSTPHPETIRREQEQRQAVASFISHHFTDPRQLYGLGDGLDAVIKTSQTTAPPSQLDTTHLAHLRDVVTEIRDQQGGGYTFAIPRLSDMKDGSLEHPFEPLPLSDKDKGTA